MVHIHHELGQPETVAHTLRNLPISTPDQAMRDQAQRIEAGGRQAGPKHGDWTIKQHALPIRNLGARAYRQ